MIKNLLVTLIDNKNERVGMTVNMIDVRRPVDYCV